MKTRKEYDWIVLDAELFYPASGIHNESDDFSLESDMEDLMKRYPESKHMVVFDGAESWIMRNQRQSEFARNNGWIPCCCEENESVSDRIQVIVALARQDKKSVLILTSKLGDVENVSDNVDVVTLNEDGDLDNVWNLSVFREVVGFDPNEIPLFNAIGGWGGYPGLVFDDQVQASVSTYLRDRKFVCRGRDLTDEIERRLQVLSDSSPSEENIQKFRTVLSEFNAEQKVPADDSKI